MSRPGELKAGRGELIDLGKERIDFGRRTILIRCRRQAASLRTIGPVGPH